MILDFVDDTIDDLINQYGCQLLGQLSHVHSQYWNENAS